MKQTKKIPIRLLLAVTLLGGGLGFVNGVWILLAGTGYHSQYSPYTFIIQALQAVFPQADILHAAWSLLHDGFQLVLAPFTGCVLGALAGWVVRQWTGKMVKGYLLSVTGGAAGLLGGILSLGVLFLNIYAT